MEAKLFTAKLGKVGSFYVVLDAYYDTDMTPADDDGMSDADLRAYKRDRWTYVYVKVSARLFGTDLGSAYLGGLQYGAGDGWSVWEADIANEVLDGHSWLVDEAVKDAKQEWELIRNAEFGEFEREVAVGKFSTGELVQ
jgi:hypothetical protein